MPLKRYSSSCFCKSECPPPSLFYIKYWLETDHPDWPEYHTPILYQHIFGESAGACVWAPIVDALPKPGQEDFDKRDTAPAPFDHAYFLRVNFEEAPFVRFEEFQATFSWNDSDLPIAPGVAPACDQTFVLPSTQVPGWNMTLTPAPLQACP